MYIYIYRRLRGINREIGFGFVSCSCRACVRAKLRERAWDDDSLRWRQHFARSPPPPPPAPAWISPRRICYYTQGF